MCVACCWLRGGVASGRQLQVGRLAGVRQQCSGSGGGSTARYGVNSDATQENHAYALGQDSQAHQVIVSYFLNYLMRTTHMYLWRSGIARAIRCAAATLGLQRPPVRALYAAPAPGVEPHVMYLRAPLSGLGAAGRGSHLAHCVTLLPAASRAARRASRRLLPAPRLAPALQGAQSPLRRMCQRRPTPADPDDPCVALSCSVVRTRPPIPFFW